MKDFKDNEPLKNQVEKLANFILNNFDEEYPKKGGAIETAIQIIEEKVIQTEKGK